jgi:carbonic anhydrase
VTDLGPRPRKKLAVVTCMDTRIHPYELLGLEPGDAHIVRNAGGIVTDDVIRSLTVSQRKLGTEEVALIMHEDCGMQGADEPGAFDDLEAELRRGMERLRSELPAGDRIRGLIFDPASGALREAA